VRGLKNSFTLQASRTRKRKQERLLELDLRLGEIFVRAQELHGEGLASPHTAAGRWQRMDAALIALSVNAPLRCGDLHRLRIGRDVVRGAEGWSLATRQAKTGHPYCIDRLWTEVGVILDTLVLDGHPETALAERLRTRDGMPLFTQDGQTPADDQWPTKVWRRHFGIGAHIVRTLWASFYAENDPAQAWAASAMLGHSDPRSRKDYEVAVQRRKAACTGQGLMANLILGIQPK
jgi:integrase